MRWKRYLLGAGQYDSQTEGSSPSHPEVHKSNHFSAGPRRCLQATALATELLSWLWSLLFLLCQSHPLRLKISLQLDNLTLIEVLCNICKCVLKLLGFYFLPLRGALSKSYKSPEISIINVYLGASPEIVLRATHKFRNKGSMEMDRTGDWCLLSCLFTSDHSWQIICCQSWKLFCPRGKVLRIYVIKPRVESNHVLCELHAIASQGCLTYTMGEVIVPDSQGCWRAQRHPSTECPASYKGQGGDQHAQLLFVS